MVSQSRRDGHKRRAQIAKTALRLFRKHGVANVGVDAILTAARASPSSLYHHFAGLPGVRLAVAAEIFRSLFQHLADAAATTATTDVGVQCDTADVAGVAEAHRAVVAVVRAHLGWVAADPPTARAMYELTALSHPRALLPAFDDEKQAAMAPLLAVLAPHVVSGALPDWPVPLIDVVMMGPTHEVARRFLAGAPFDLLAMQAVLPELAWSTLRAATGLPPPRPPPGPADGG